MWPFCSNESKWQPQSHERWPSPHSGPEHGVEPTASWSLQRTETMCLSFPFRLGDTLKRRGLEAELTWKTHFSVNHDKCGILIISIGTEIWDLWRHHSFNQPVIIVAARRWQPLCKGSFLFWECAEHTEVRSIRTSGLAEVCIFEFYTLFTPDLTLAIHL